MLLLESNPTTGVGALDSEYANNPFTTPTVDLAATGAERRRGLRVRQQRPVKVFEPRGNRSVGGQTEDVSATGLRIDLPAWTAIRPGEVLNIAIGLDENGHRLANRRQLVPAKVVWVKRDTGPLAFAAGRAEVGVEFLSSISAHADAA